jgi:Flp pilus assembly protein TadD
MRSSESGFKKKKLTVPTLPQRTRSYEIDALAVAALQSQSPATWVFNEQRHDYGRDFLVTVPSATGQVGGDDFWIQLKGSGAPHYLVDGRSLSHDLSVATLNHLLLLSSPAMLAVCDVSKQERPIYWVWIDDALTDIQQRNPVWKTQESVSIRVPIANLFGATIDAIEDNVRTWHRERRVDSIIGKFVRPAIGVSTIAAAEHADVEAYAQEVLVPRLRDAQLVEVGESGEATSHTPDQRDFNTKLRELANSLAKFRDDDARSLLAQLDASSELATPRLRAAFHNSLGVLAIHAGDHERASTEFSEAASPDPEQPTIATNLATVQYALFHEDQARWPLPDDWERRLAQILEKNPQLLPAIKLRLRWVAEVSGLKAASDFAHQYSLPEGPHRELLIALAEIYLFANQPREAIDVLAALEPPANGQEAWFYAIRGHSLFALAVPSAPQIGDGRLLLQGMGPGDLNFPLLAQACEATEKALSYATEQAPQHVVEEIAANAARARLLRGQHDEAIKLSLAYAARFPESKTLSGVVASAFFMSGRAEKAVPYAKRALSPDDATGETYRNLFLVLTAAERFDEVLHQTGEREREGFRGEDEKNLSYQIAAIAYAENNDFAQAERCITNFVKTIRGTSTPCSPRLKYVAARGSLLLIWCP